MIQIIMLWIGVAYTSFLVSSVIIYVIVKKHFPSFNFNEMVSIIGLVLFVYIFATISHPWLYFFIMLGVAFVYTVVLYVLMVTDKLKIDLFDQWFMK